VVREPQFGGGGTLLYDAIFLASDEVIKKQQGRKALIIFRWSRQWQQGDLEDAVMTAQQADTVVYRLDGQAYRILPGFGRRGGGRRTAHQRQERPDGRRLGTDSKETVAACESRRSTPSKRFTTPRAEELAINIVWLHSGVGCCIRLSQNTSCDKTERHADRPGTDGYYEDR
jgi:hypothetical protein